MNIRCELEQGMPVNMGQTQGWTGSGISTPALTPGAGVAKGQTDTPINRHNWGEVLR